MSTKRASLIPNTFQTPNDYVDLLLPLLTGTETKVLLFVARKTFGWGKAAEVLAIAEIMAAVKGSRSAVSAALNHLVAMAVVTREGESGQEFLYALQLDKAVFHLPDDQGGCVKSTHPPEGTHPEEWMGSPNALDGGHPETEGGTPYTLNPLSETQVETQVNTPRVRPPILKPAQLLAAEQSACPLWAALCAALGVPTPGLEHERATAAWRDLLARGESPADLAARVPGKVAAYLRLMRGRDGEPLPLTRTALAGHWAELDAVPADVPPVLPPPDPETEAASVAARAASEAERERLAAERDALLARLETTRAAQSWWQNTAIHGPPRLYGDCWRAAIFVPPRLVEGRAVAALVFPDAATADRARASPLGLQTARERIGRYGAWQGGVGVILLSLAELDDGNGERRDDDGGADHDAGGARAGDTG